MKKKILVTGGAGYIGSFIVRNLRDKGYEVAILDNFVSGHRQGISGFTVFDTDLVTESRKVVEIFKSEKFDGVVHMASYIQMGESFRNPGKYFTNNIQSSINLFEAMTEASCKKLIFSSSAGVYGNPKKLPILETDAKRPENPYGETKLMIEKILHWYDKAHELKSISIRYFNAAGASLAGDLGEDHPNESHIIPIIIKCALSKSTFNIFGEDYKTPDGTCIRDYVHVLDLAEAHSLGLAALFEGKGTNYYNAGIGRGYSNLEIVNEVEKLAGKFSLEFKPRRLGDADALYASVDKIKNELKWEPRYTIAQIIETAHKWHTNNPKGFTF